MSSDPTHVPPSPLPWTPPPIENVRRLPARPSPLGSLVASARRVKEETIRGQRSSAPGTSASSWQADAWDMYDLVGELRFIANTLAGRMGQARFYVGRVGAGDDDPVPIEDQRWQDLLDQVGHNNAGRSQLIVRLALNMFVAGEAWLVGVPDDLLPAAVVSSMGESLPSLPPPLTPSIPRAVTEPNSLPMVDLNWFACSVSEITTDSTGLITVRLGENSSEHIVTSPEALQLIRVWRPHPRKVWEPDSPTRSSLPVLRELVGLTMHISAQVDSRLAGAGVLVYAQSAQRAMRLAAGLTPDPSTDDATGSDPFTEALLEAMITPISDRSSASALVPLLVAVPDEAVSLFNHLTFSTPLDAEARPLRDEAIRRLALGLDCPPELLLGTAGVNHWGAWLVQEDVITTHIEPGLALLCDALTTQFLWPVLLATGMVSTWDEAQEFAVWYDVGHMIIRPDRSNDAKDLFDRGELSGATLRESAGFNEDDAAPLPPGVPSDPAVVAALELVKASPDLLRDPGLAGVVAQIRGVLTPGATASPSAPSPAPVPAPAPEAPAVTEPSRGTPATSPADGAGPVPPSGPPASGGPSTPVGVA